MKATTSHSNRTCVECRARFDGQSWQRLCWRCWREQKDHAAKKSAYETGYKDGLIAGRKRSGVDEALLSSAITLCHPDRHPPERQAVANTVTARLLELRGALAA